MNRSATAAPTSTTATSRTRPMLPPRWLRSTDIRGAPLRSCVAIRAEVGSPRIASAQSRRIAPLNCPRHGLRARGSRRPSPLRLRSRLAMPVPIEAYIHPSSTLGIEDDDAAAVVVSEPSRIIVVVHVVRADRQFEEPRLVGNPVRPRMFTRQERDGARTGNRRFAVRRAKYGLGRIGIVDRNDARAEPKIPLRVSG